MKKLSMLMAAAATTIAANAATMNFGYCGEPQAAIGTADPDSLTTAACICLPESVLQDYVGNKVAGVQFVLGENLINYEVTLFMTHALNEKPFATKDVTGSSKWTVGLFDEGYEITADKPVYIGYMIHSENRNQYPMCVDQAGQAANTNGGFFIIVDDEEGKTPEDLVFHYPASLWQTTGMQFGNLCVRAVLEGDNLPEDQGEILGVLANEYVRAGDDFEVQTAIQNRASNDITSIKVLYKVGKEPNKTVDITLDSPITPGELGVVRVPMSYPSSNANLQILMALQEVNGKTNKYNAGAATSTNCVEGLYRRNIVVEANTGAKCPLAPLGLVAFDEMTKAHPDDFIGINIHNYGERDEMYCSDFSKWNEWSKIEGEAPLCLVNRNTTTIGVFDTDASFIEDVYQLLTTGSGAPVKIEFSTEILEGNTKAAAKSFTSSCIDMDGINYGIEWVLTQDKIGPYNQQNAWAEKIEGFPPLAGWDDKGASVPTVYNDVAVYDLDFYGRSKSVPSSLKTGNYYGYDRELALNACSRLEGAELANVNVIALVLNKDTREIVNAAKAPLGGKTSGYDDAVSSVGGVEADGVNVYAVGGGIAVDGECGHVAVYSTDGALAATASGAGHISLAPGLYLVEVSCATGVSATKVIVR